MIFGLKIGIVVIQILILAIVQIWGFKKLPLSCQYLTSCNSLLTTIISFAITSVILTFAGFGKTTGALTLASSAVFGCWLMGFNKIHKCGYAVKWYTLKVGKLLSAKLFPYFVGIADNPKPNWLF